MMNPLEKYPVEKRLFKDSASEYESWMSNSCIFGIEHHGNPLSSIDNIPLNTKAIYSFFAEGNYDVVKNLIENGINEELEYLMLGFEHSNARYNFKDYTRISELLSSVKFPKLSTFIYGDDFLLANEDAYYPYLGDITTVLKNMPALEKLELYGVFDLEEKINLTKIKHVSIHSYWVQDELIGLIKQSTIDNLLQSNYELLEEIALDLNVYRFYSDLGEKYFYQLDENFFNNSYRLKYVDICGQFKTGTKEWLSKILNERVEKLFLEDIREGY